MKNEPIYLSPILYSSLKRKEFNSIRHNKTKSDVFALGMSILEAALEKSV